MALSGADLKQFNELKAKIKAGTISQRELTRYNYLGTTKGVSGFKKATMPTAAATPANPGASPSNIKGTNIPAVTAGSDPVDQALNAGNQTGKIAADLSNVTTNANEKNPFGEKNITYDENGQPTVTTTLSGDQQKILDQGESLTQTGQQKAADNLGGYKQYQADTSGMGNFSFQSDDAARQRIEDATFQRLSRGMDTRQKQATADLEQSLYNRGIQFSSDPNSRYQQELSSLKQSQQDERQSYEQQAVTMGGQEMQNNYNIASGAYNTNLTGNQARNSAMQGQQQQTMSDTAALQGMGTGLMTPNFQQFQGNAVDPSVGASTAATFEGMKGDPALKKAQTKYYNSKATSGGGGSSSSSSSSTTSPFQSSY